MMRYLAKNKAKTFSLYVTTYGPVGIGVYFDWFSTDTKKLKELHFQLLKLSIIFTWDK